MLGLAFAVSGFWRGMPPPLWGDELRHYTLLAGAALELVFLPFAAPNPDAAWPAPAGRFVLPGIVAWLVGEGLVHLLLPRLRRALMARAGGHAILFGLSPLGTSLVAEWRRAGRPVLVVSTREEDRITALSLDASHLAGEIDDPAVLARCSLAQAAHVALITDSDTRNLELALSVLAHWREKHSNGVRHLHVSLGDAYLRANLSQRLRQAAGSDTEVELHVFSPPQIAVRQLLRQHPLGACRQSDGPAGLWIFGGGSLAEELVLNVLRLECHGDDAPARIAIADRAAEHLRHLLQNRWGGSSRIRAVSFEASGVEEGEPLFGRMAAHVDRPSAVCFCAGDDTANLAAAAHFCAVMEGAKQPIPPLWVLQSTPSAAGLVTGLDFHPWVRTFGSSAQAAAELLHGEKLDELARIVHHRYVEEALGRGEALRARRSLVYWPDLPEDLKDDNRNTTDHHFIKLADTGCTLAEGLAGKPWTEEEIERLALAEHERWVVQREITGWKLGARDDEQKRHPDLLPWEALAEPRRELDRNVVRGVPELFGLLGVGVHRERVLVVSGPRTAWAFTTGFEAAVDKLLASRSQGGPLRLWIEGDSALAWRVAEKWIERGGPRLGVVLATPAAELLARQATPANRARVAAVLRRADRMRFATGLTVAPAGRLSLCIDVDEAREAAAGHVIDAEGREIALPDGDPP
jgi:hypothetical protein